MAERYFSAQQLSEIMGGVISVKTLANWRSSKDADGPPYTKFGNRVAYPESAFQKWARARNYVCTSLRAPEGAPA